MADDTNTAEREAAERWLRDRYGAYRGHFAWRELEEAFLAGRASLAASAGSEKTMDEAFDCARAALLQCPDRASVRAVLDTLRARVEKAMGTESAGSEPVASIYITPAGEREMDDWKVKLPPGRNILYTHHSPASEAKEL